MNNKKVLIALVVAAAILSPCVFAQDTALPNPGLTPDSPLYFLDTWSEDISLALTTNPESKTRKQIAISEEKLAEAETMGNKGKGEAAEVAADRYGKMVTDAAKGVAAAAQSGEAFADAVGELLATSTSISQQVLAGVYEKVPEQARSAIQKAMQVSSQGMEQALNAISNTNREQVREKVEQNLNKARENAPEEAQQFIPATIPSGPGGAEPEEGQETIPGTPGAGEESQQGPGSEVEPEQEEQSIPSPVEVPGAGGGRP